MIPKLLLFLAFPLSIFGIHGSRLPHPTGHGTGHLTGPLGINPVAGGPIGHNAAAMGMNPAAMGQNQASFGVIGQNPAAMGAIGQNPAGMGAMGAMDQNAAGLGAMDQNAAGIASMGAMGPNAAGIGAMGPNAAGIGAMGPNAAGIGAMGPNAAGIGAMGPNAAGIGAMGPNAAGIGAMGPNAAGIGAMGPNAAGIGAMGPNAAGIGAMGPNAAGIGAMGPNAAGIGAMGPNAAGLGAMGQNAAGIGAMGPNAAGLGAMRQNAAGLGAMGPMGGQNLAGIGAMGPMGGQNPAGIGAMGPMGGHNPAGIGAMDPMGGQNPAGIGAMGPMGGQNPAGIGAMGPMGGQNPAGIGAMGPIGSQFGGGGGLNGGSLLQNVNDALGWIKNYLDVFILSPFTPAPSSDKPNPWASQYKDNFSGIGKRCPRNTFYASFNPEHRSAVEALNALYDDREDMNGMLEFSEFVKTREEVHPMVWYASFIRANCRRFPEALNAVDRPSPIFLFPSIFFPEVVNGMYTPGRQKRQIPTRGQQQQCAVLDERFGADNGPENALWYFREDLQINAHHWIWHLLFPTSTARPISRRGELFYFFHHDLLARYTVERLANGFQPVGPLAFYPDFNAVVAEGYNPHLQDGISTLPWAPRPANQQLSQNFLPREIMDTLANLTVIRDRLLESVNTGTVNNRGQRLAINQGDNINILGELTEASLASINPDWYGMSGFHNDGHWVIANLIGNWARGPVGVMGHQATALRDMVFYRWHKMVDDIFQAYKLRHLPPYGLNSGDHPLVLNGIRVGGLRVIPDGAQQNVNNLRTFWNMRRILLDGGLDFNIPNNQQAPQINVCAKHLDHDEFSYEIQVTNSRGQAANAYVRIFMAPRFKSVNGQERYTYEEQRGLFFTMDAFPFMLQPGNNVITRRSIDSTLTAPWPRSIQQLRQDAQSGQRANVPCECGYPHHLLLPRGTEQGMPFDLFVMLTDANVDMVNGALGSAPSPLGERQCVASHIHCGVNGRDYPDRKPMGYPFDRVAYTVPNDGQTAQPVNIEGFVSNIPNMATTPIIITHQNIQVGQ